MYTSYGASLDSLESAFAPIELTAVSYGYLIGPTTVAERAGAVLAAELLARVCALDSLENASQLAPPAREALNAIFLLATGALVELPIHAEVASNFNSLMRAEEALKLLEITLIAPYLPAACEPAYRCLVHGSADPRLAAAADALLPYVDQGVTNEDEF
jgi:hypothetical protein